LARSHARHYVRTREDDGGVHLNSGIPNHAFYLFAKRLGGHAWKTAGHVWYDALRSGLSERCTFAEFAAATVHAATAHGEAAVTALEHAWASVGIGVRSGSASAHRLV